MKTWEEYEELATYLLNKFASEFGLERVEGKQEVEGLRSGTKWEIDAKGFFDKGESFIIVECRRHTTSKQNQEKLGGLAYKIIDAGAKGGILVSPLGFQEGAAKVAKAENVIEVILDHNSTPHNFGLEFLNKIIKGIRISVEATLIIEESVTRKCDECGKDFSPISNEVNCRSCRK